MPLIPLILALAWAGTPPTQPAGSTPTTRIARPSVSVQWSPPEVRVAARVVLQQGALEFFACFPGKEHESILRIDATAEQIYQALGLIGVEPGNPPEAAHNPARRCAGGALVDIDVEWRDGTATRRVSAFEWLRDAQYARRPIQRPWMFLGSAWLPDGTLAAGQTGEGVALVDFPDALLGLSRRLSSRSGELWVEANAAAIPPRHTSVTICLRPARLPTLDVRIDFRGVVHVDGVPTEAADLADLVELRRLKNAAFVQTIIVDDALGADVAALRAALKALGIAPDACSFRPPVAAHRATSAPSIPTRTP